MDPFSWAIIGGACLVTGTITYFVSRYSSDISAEHLDERVNNQIVIQQERDNSKEFAQWLTIAILVLITVGAILYCCVRVAIRSAINQRINRNAPNMNNRNNENVGNVLDV